MCGSNPLDAKNIHRLFVDFYAKSVQASKGNRRIRVKSQPLAILDRDCTIQETSEPKVRNPSMPGAQRESTT